MAFEYNTKIYLDATNGDDTTGDGSESNPYQFFDSSPVKSLVENGSVYEYEVLFLSSSSENITIDLSLQPIGDAEPFVKFTALNNSKFSGTGNFLSLNLSYNRRYGVWLNGFYISTYTKAIVATAYACATIFEDCFLINTGIYTVRMGKLVFFNTSLIDVNFGNKTVSVSGQLTLHSISGCYFENVGVLDATYPFIAIHPSENEFISVGGISYRCDNNSFVNTDIAIVTPNPVDNYEDLKNNNYYNCNGTFYDITNTVGLPTTASLVPFDSVAAMQAEYLSVFGVATNLYEDETFNNIILDSQGFQAAEDNYRLSQYQGAKRYGKTGTIDNGDYENLVNMELVDISPAALRKTASSANSSATIVIPELDRLRKIRRFVLNYERVVLPTTSTPGNFVPDTEVQLTVQISTDGVNYSGAGIYRSGIYDNSGVFEFDLTELYAKSVKVTFTLAGSTDQDIYIYGASLECYTIEDLLPISTRTEILQKAPFADGWLIDTETYKVETETGAKSFSEVEAQASSIEYGDLEDTNISSFMLTGKSYPTFEPSEITIENIKAIKAGRYGTTIKLSDLPCSNFDTKQIKFLNRFGVPEYLFFYGKDEKQNDYSNEQYQKFEVGYRNVNGDTQDSWTIYRDDFKRSLEPVLSDLNANQNIWLADKWMFSDFKVSIYPVDSENFALTSTERLLKATVSQEEYNMLFERFAEDDKITFHSTDSEKLSMWGVIQNFSENTNEYAVYFKFDADVENDALTTLDEWTGSEFLYIEAYEGWKSVVVSNKTVVKSGQDTISVRLGLKANPSVSYKI